MLSKSGATDPHLMKNIIEVYCVFFHILISMPLLQTVTHCAWSFNTCLRTFIHIVCQLLGSHDGRRSVGLHTDGTGKPSTSHCVKYIIQLITSSDHPKQRKLEKPLFQSSLVSSTLILDIQFVFFADIYIAVLEIVTGIGKSAKLKNN